LPEKYLIGADKLSRRFKALASDQVPFAVATGLTRIAQRAQNDVERSLPQKIDRPTPFTQRGVGSTVATKRRPTSRVFIKRVQAQYLGLLERGGTLRPKRKSLVVPAGVRLNRYGNLTRNKVKKLLARKDVFSGTVNGTPGIWQRRKRKGPKLLIAYTKQRQVTPQLGFRQTAVNSIKRNASERMISAFDFAMRTRKDR
jgi:hypothetical protein